MQRHKAGLLLSEEFRGIVHMCGDYTPEKGENQSDCHSSSSHSLSFFLSVSSNGFPEIMHDRCMSTSFFSLSLSVSLMAGPLKHANVTYVSPSLSPYVSLSHPLSLCSHLDPMCWSTLCHQQSKKAKHYIEEKGIKVLSVNPSGFMA